MKRLPRSFCAIMTDYRGSTGYGEKFTLDILGDPLAGPADDVNDAADEAIKRFPFIDGTRQCAGGASYGGHLVWILKAEHSRVFYREVRAWLEKYLQ